MSLGSARDGDESESELSEDGESSEDDEGLVAPDGFTGTLDYLTELAELAQSQLDSLTVRERVNKIMRATNWIGPLRQDEFGAPGERERALRYAQLRDILAGAAGDSITQAQAFWVNEADFRKSLQEWFNEDGVDRVRLTGSWTEVSTTASAHRAFGWIMAEHQAEFERSAEHLRTLAERGGSVNAAEVERHLGKRPAPDARYGPLAVDQENVWRLMEGVVDEAIADPERPARELATDPLRSFDARTVAGAEQRLAAVAEAEGEAVAENLRARAAELIGSRRAPRDPGYQDAVAVIAAELDPRRPEILAGALRVDFEFLRGAHNSEGMYAFTGEGSAAG